MRCNEAGQGRAGQGRAGHGRAGQGRAGQGRAGQGRAGQGRAGQGRAGQGRAGQGRAGQGRLNTTSTYLGSNSHSQVLTFYYASLYKKKSANIKMYIILNVKHVL